MGIEWGLLIAAFINLILMYVAIFEDNTFGVIAMAVNGMALCAFSVAMVY